MKVNQLQQQQQQLHPQQQHLLLLPPFVVRRATHHNPVAIHLKNAGAAARCNIATKSVNERIGAQEATSKNANDWEKKKKKRRRGVAAAKTKKQQNKIFHFLIFDLGKKMKNLDIIKLVCFFQNDVGCLSLAKLLWKSAIEQRHLKIIHQFRRPPWYCSWVSFSRGRPRRVFF